MTEYAEANPSVARAVEVGLQARYQGAPMPPSVIGASYHLCARVDVDDAEVFWVEQVIQGAGLQPDDPARVLVKRLSKHAAGGRLMHPDDAFRYGLVAWNHFRAGNKI